MGIRTGRGNKDRTREGEEGYATRCEETTDSFVWTSKTLFFTGVESHRILSFTNKTSTVHTDVQGPKEVIVGRVGAGLDVPLRGVCTGYVPHVLPSRQGEGTRPRVPVAVTDPTSCTE